MFARLVARKEKEKAVSVFDGSYFTLLDYADFEDLKEICLAHPKVATFLKAFGGDSHICQVRFLELQSLHEKLAGLRNVSEAEISFLQHLARRLGQIVDPAVQQEPDRSIWVNRPPVDEGQVQAAAAPSAVATAPPPPAPPQPAVAAATTPSAAPQPVAAAAPAVPEVPAAAPPAPRSTEQRASASDLENALVNGDDKAVLTALFTEIRRLSEHMTDSQGPANPPVWDKVSESPWYARRYAALGMRPVSDFYSLYLGVRERLNEGATNQELQSFLQAHAYQQVIMAVGVFFQQNKVF